jgi:transcription elongation GreA/GreB family factor
VSRAFVKEDAGGDEPDRPQPSGPNYVTPRGRELLAEKVRALETQLAGKSKEEQRDLRYWRERLATSVVVDNSKASPAEARFGATVKYREGKRERTVQIVGQDEADEGGDKISWDSAVARALLGLSAGDASEILDGDDSRPIVVESVSY